MIRPRPNSWRTTGRRSMMILGISMSDFREIRHFHLFCGLGGGAAGFNRGDPDFHEWADGVAGSTVEKLIATMVRQGKWDDPDWLREYVRRQTQRGAARPDIGLGWGMATFGAGAVLEQNGRRK